MIEMWADTVAVGIEAGIFIFQPWSPLICLIFTLQYYAYIWLKLIIKFTKYINKTIEWKLFFNSDDDVYLIHETEKCFECTFVSV